jgi:hypothetical protein
MDAGVERQFRVWLERLGTGCRFAAHIGREFERANFFTFMTNDVDPADVELFLDDCGRARRVGVLLLPFIREEAEIVDVALSLGTHPRWQVVVDPSMARDSSEVGIGMVWTTATNLVTHAMGFAPTLRMPVTRLAPCVAIAAWTGGHDNQYRKRPLLHEVTMGDAPTDMDEARYKQSRAKTVAESGEMTAGDVDITALRNLAFRFSAAAASRLFRPADPA